MELDLRDYLKIIRKRIWLVLCIVVLACAGTAVVSFFFMQPVYEASTKLIVNKSNDRVGMGAGADQLNLNDITLNIRLIDTYKEIIRTPAIMEKVAQEYPQLGLTTEELIRKVKVSSVNNTQVMTLVVQDTSYETAMMTVNAVSHVFQREIPRLMSVDNVSLLNEARPNENPSPVKPNPTLNVAISFVLSLMIAVGLAFLLEYLDDTIKNEEDVQQVLGIPTLAMIMRIREEDLSASYSGVDKRKQVGEAKHATTNH